MTAIIAKVEQDAVTIKGDTLVLTVKDDGSGEITEKQYVNKLSKITNKLVLGFSCMELDSKLCNAILAYGETYSGSSKAASVVRNICQFLNTLLKREHGSVELLLAGYDDRGAVLYTILHNGSRAIFKRSHNRYAAVGVGAIVDDIVAREGNDIPLDDIFFKVSEAEKAHIEAYGSILFHIGGHIAGWRITPESITELPISSKEIPTQVDKGDFIRSIKDRIAYRDNDKFPK